MPDPAEALDQLLSVPAPGGVLLVSHWDWDTQVFNIADLMLARKLVAAFADTQQGWMEHFDPAMGRKLHGLLSRRSDCQIVDHGVVVLVENEWAEGQFGYEQTQNMAELLVTRHVIEVAEAVRWLGLLAEAQTSRTYAYSINHYWCLARRV